MMAQKLKSSRTAAAPAVSKDKKSAALQPPAKSPRKRAADLFDAAEDESIVENGTPPKRIKTTQSKHKASNGLAKSSTADEPAAAVVSKVRTKTTKTTSISANQISIVETTTTSEFEASDDEDEADTANLLAGFETSSESGSDAEEGGIPLEKLPALPAQSKKALSAARKHNNENDTDTQEPTVLYIGHIPHGFYERQMRAYFSQFGDIRNLRLARNKRTGAPKHYAFIEFISADVADIVQRTMDKYLLFNHILHVRRMLPEEVHEKMWQGANKRYKVVPWTAIQARGLRQPRSRDVWKKRVAREDKRRSKRKATLDEYGYDFAVPSLKKVDDVAEHGLQEEAMSAIEEGVPVPEAIVDANTVANGGEPLSLGGPVPADEVELKKQDEQQAVEADKVKPTKTKKGSKKKTTR